MIQPADAGAGQSREANCGAALPLKYLRARSQARSATRRPSVRQNESPRSVWTFPLHPLRPRTSPTSTLQVALALFPAQSSNFPPRGLRCTRIARFPSRAQAPGPLLRCTCCGRRHSLGKGRGKGCWLVGNPLRAIHFYRALAWATPRTNILPLVQQLHGRHGPDRVIGPFCIPSGNPGIQLRICQCEEHLYIIIQRLAVSR
jgi:hypothetical protein